MDKIYKRTNTFYVKNKAELIVAFVSTFVLGMIAHAYGFLNNIFSHDSLNALYADMTEETWKLSLGRFIVPIYRLIRGPIAIPFVIGIISLFFIFLITVVIIKIFNIKSKPIIILVSGILVTNITITAATATYIYELDFDVFATLLSTLSVYFWKKSSKIYDFIISIFLLFISLGIYQSNITVTTTLIIIILIIELVNNYKFKVVLKKGINGALIVGISSILYYSITIVLPIIFKFETESRTDVLNVSDSLSQNVTLLNSFNSMLYYELQRIIHPFSILPQMFSASINVILLLVGLTITLFLVVKLDKGKAKEKILIFVLIALLPFSIGFIEILTKGTIHELMIFSFWFIPIFILLLTQNNNLDSNRSFKKIVSTIAIICIFVTIWNNILVANTAYLKKDLEQKSTLSIMTRVISDLEKRSDYIVGETKICFINADYKTSNKPGFESVSKIAGLEFTNVIGSPEKEWYYCSYDKYFTYFLNYPINIVDNSFITKEIHDKIMEMPSFPANGYIENYDGVLVIRT